MIATAMSLIGGRRGALALAAGLLAGMLLMRAVAGMWIIPAAERVARAEVREEFAAAAGAALAEDAAASREIERRARNASDDDLRRTLRGRPH